MNTVGLKRCFRLQEFAYFNIILLFTFSCDQQNLENFYQISSVLDTGIHTYLPMVLQQRHTNINGPCWRRPQGHYFSITKSLNRSEIVHTLLFEKYGLLKNFFWMGGHHRQENELKCDFNSSRKTQTFRSNFSRKTQTFRSGLLLCQRFRRRHEETACKRRRIETSLVLVIVIMLLHALMCVVSYTMMIYFGIKLGLSYLNLKIFDLTKCLLLDTFLMSSNHFHHQWIGRQNKQLETECTSVAGWLKRKFLMEKMRRRFFYEKNVWQARLIKQNEPEVRFFDWILMSSLLYLYSMTFILHKLQLRIFFI